MATFAAQNIIEMRKQSATFDEVAHLPAGYTYLVKHDFRLNPEHPPLLKVLCALPLLALQPRIDFNDPNWEVLPKEYAFGSSFLYSNNADRLLFWGRLPVVGIAVLLGFFVFRWSQQLYGNAAGLVALTLFAFSPNLIAHSHLVTTDIGVAAFLTMAFYFLWRHSCLGDNRSLYWGSLAMGAALASKFSAVVLFPVGALMLWSFHSPHSQTNPTPPVTSSGTHVKGNTRGKAHKEAKKERMRSSSQGQSWEKIIRGDRRKVAAVVVFVALALLVVLLSYLRSLDPSLYLKGMEQVNKNHRPDFPFYLHGSLKAGGWWFYFLVVFVIKATAPFIILVLGRIILFLRNSRIEWKSEIFLLLPAIVFFVATSALADPLGVRYLLPVFPFLMVFSSGVINYLPGKRAASWTLWGLLGWHIASSLLAFPNHISYFNEFVGGASHGTDWLDDSNVDWGQELKELKNDLNGQNIENVTLLSFSPYDNPSYYGIQCIRPPQEAWSAIFSNPQPGYYAVSAHWVARAKGLGFDWKSKYPLTANIGNSMFVFKVP